MSEPRPQYCAKAACAGASPLTGWRAQLMSEIERSVKNPNRQTVIVIRFDGAGNCQVIPMAAPTARIKVETV